MRSLRVQLITAFIGIAVLTTVLAATFGTYTARYTFRQYVERPVETTRPPAIVAPPTGLAAPVRPRGRFGARERTFASRITIAIWTGTALAAFLGALVALWLARRIVRPVIDLTRARARSHRGVRPRPFRWPVRTRSRTSDAPLTAWRRTRARRTPAPAVVRRDHARTADAALGIQGQLEGMFDRVIEPTPERIAGLHGQTLLLRRLITDLRDLARAGGSTRLHP